MIHHRAHTHPLPGKKEDTGGRNIFGSSRDGLRGVTKPRCTIEKVVLDIDQDGDGIYDLDDIVQGARRDLQAKPQYKDAYYAGGYPPENEGVCTAGCPTRRYFLKSMPMSLPLGSNPGTLRI
jgi:hypothetical protein